MLIFSFGSSGGMHLTKAVLSILLLLRSVSGTVTPGLKVVTTTEGWNHVFREEIPILEKALFMTHMPGVTGVFYVPLVGKMQYTLHNIVLRKIEILQPSLAFKSQGASILLYNSSCEISAEWSYRRVGWHIIPLFDRGSCNASTANTSLSVNIRVRVGFKGQPVVFTTGCRCNIGELRLHIHSHSHEKERVLYDLLFTVMRDHLKKILNRKLCDSAQTSANEFGITLLESIPVVAKLDNISEINYALLKAPAFKPTHVESLHKGEFFSISRPIEAPITPPPIPSVSNTTMMLYIWLTDYIFNSGGYVYHTAGVLQYTIAPSTIPPGFPIKLNTLYFKYIFPQFYNKYPDMGIVLQLNTTKPPLLCIVSTSANITVLSAINVYAVHYNGTSVLAFVLGMRTVAVLKPALRSDGSRPVVYADMASIETQMSLLYNTIGEFNINAVQQFVNFAIDTTIFPEVSSYFKRGIPLPVPRAVTFIRPKMTLGEGYIVIATDFHYKPIGAQRQKSGAHTIELFPSILT